MTNDGLQEAAEAVAIIGMQGRFPGAPDIETFWQNLRDGVESIVAFSDEEAAEAGVTPELRADPNYVKAGAPLDQIEMFDAAFFDISPREADMMDPQHRLFLECAWEALESAGYDTSTYAGWIGAYAGVSFNSYILFNLYPALRLHASVSDLQVLTANDKDHLTTRASYKLNLRGPSMAVQSACSTSLVAVHLACQGLLGYQCDLALAGGSSIGVPQRAGYLYAEGGIMSPDGHCRPFDAQAAGTVFGNGVGVVVLKRLSDALADQDTIYAVIKGSSVNNDGAVKVGYTAPSVEGQASVITVAQELADVEPDSISYIEAHGTGTPLGDPIEIAALTKAFRRQTSRQGFCAVGSVKSNIGHLDAAAGIAGLIKTTLALTHELLPPSLHFEQPNPKIDFAASPFFVNDRLRPWPRTGSPRRAGVSSFGIGGTNAHVIVEEAPPRATPTPDTRPWQLVPLSARSAGALERASQRLAAHLRAHPELPLADLAYTLQVGRRAFSHRRVLVCRDHAQALALLEAPATPSDSQLQEARDRRVAWLFPGQGSQYTNMARDLYQHEPLFREQVDHCAELLRPHLGLDLCTILYTQEPRTQNPEPKTGAADQAVLGSQFSVLELDQTQYAQPALFVVEYALARLWMHWGVQPAVMLGHSIGEYVAACLAGVFSLEDALRLVATRGRLMQRTAAGAMLSVPLPADEVRRLLGDQLALAAVNSPTQCVVSGPPAAIATLADLLADEGVTCQRLHTSHAFHSAQMEPIVAAFVDAVRRVPLQTPHLRYLSNLTGTWITPAQATDPTYWGQHLRQTVLFAPAVQTLLQDGELALLEVGPGRTLTSLLRQYPQSPAALIPSLPHPREATSASQALTSALGQLWLAGVPMAWSALAGTPRTRVPLPTYPFERQPHWIDAPTSPAVPAPAPRPSGKRSDLADWFYQPAWQPAPLLAPAAVRTPGTCLLLVEPNALGSALAGALTQAGWLVTQVLPGPAFAAEGDHYSIDPRDPAGYSQLLLALLARGLAPQLILHAWSLALPSTQQEALQARGFYSLLFLAQALGSHLAAQPLELRVLTDQVHSVAGHEPLLPAKATVLGPVRVIPQEYPQVSTQLLDLGGLPGEPRATRALVAQLLAELEQPLQAGAAVVAYRGPQRWQPAYPALRLADTTRGRARLRQGGVYLITGGLGGVGAALAAHLAATVQARLVLVGRSGLPERQAWTAWLEEHPAEEATSARIRQVQALEAAGAEVLVLRADVADPAAMRQVQQAVAAHFGSLHGIIHAAGTVQRGVIQFKTKEAVEQVMAAKVRGTEVLDAIFGETELDFLVLCSSGIAVVGEFGQVDYCAANAFLDTYAQAQAAQGRRHVLSIDWDTWQEVGMTVTTAVPEDLRELRAAQLAQGLTTAEGCLVFERLLALPLPQVIVSTIDFQQQIEHTQGLREAIAQLDRATGDRPAHPRPNISSDYIAPRTELEREIAGIWQRVLGIEQIGIDDNFFELGGDSLIAVQAVAQIKDAVRIDIPAVGLYQRPTIRSLGELVSQDEQELDQARIDKLEERKELASTRKQYQEQRRARKQGRREEVLE